MFRRYLVYIVNKINNAAVNIHLDPSLDLSPMGKKSSHVVFWFFFVLVYAKLGMVQCTFTRWNNATTRNANILFLIYFGYLFMELLCAVWWGRVSRQVDNIWDIFSATSFTTDLWASSFLWTERIQILHLSLALTITHQSLTADSHLPSFSYIVSYC